MRVLILTADYPPIRGGISSVALHISRELVKMGHQVTVVAPYFSGQDTFDAAEPVDVIRFRGYGLGWLRFIPMFLKSIPLMKRTDLILGINVSHGGLMAYLAKAMHHKPYITFAYAYEFLRFKETSFAARLLRVAYRGSQKVVAISSFTRDNLIRFGVQPEHIVTIFPGAPGANLQSLEELEKIRKKYSLEKGKIILSVGRFVSRKGHETLVRAMPQILKSVPDAKLVFVGHGPCMAQVSSVTDELRLRNTIIFAGELKDEEVSGLYQICDVFALPTGRDTNGQVEGFGLVFTEAQAYAKPVVAGRSGGVVDAVKDGETGLIIEPDDPEGLADAIVRVLVDRELSQSLGEQGRQRIESELNWRRFTEQMMRIVDQ